MKGVFSLLLAVFLSSSLLAQVFNPVSWETNVEQLQDGKFALKVTASIEKNWHLYSQSLPSDDGPIATEFAFPEGAEYELLGAVKEPEAITEYDPNFDMDLNFFKDQVTFTQLIKPSTPEAFEITAEVYFMVCDEEKCLPPEYVDLVFAIPATGNVTEPMPEETTGDLVEPEEADLKATEASNEQNDQAVRWSFQVEKLEEANTYLLLFEAAIGEGWHLYSQHLPNDDGPIATAFYFEEDKHELNQCLRRRLAI